MRKFLFSQFKYQIIIFVPMIVAFFIFNIFSNVMGFYKENINGHIIGTGELPSELMCTFDGTVDLEPAVLDAIKSALINSKTEVNFNGATCFAPIDLRIEGDWFFISLVGVKDISKTSIWSVSADGLWAESAIVHRTDSGFHAAIAGTVSFSTELAGLPESIIPNTSKQIIDPLLQNKSINTKSQEASNYIFPLETGYQVKYGTRGVHTGEYTIPLGGNTMAVDLISDGNTSINHAPNHLLASEGGTVTKKCSDQDQNTTYIVIDNGTVKFLYSHILSTTAPGQWSTINKGDYIGYLQTSTFDNNPCGWANQASNEFHVHFAFLETSSLTLGDWTLNTASQTWTNGSEVWNIGEYKQIGNPICGAPSLSFPNNNDTLTSRNVTFQWNSPNCSNITDYTLHVTTGMGPEDGIIRDTGTNGNTSSSYTFPNDGTFYWHVAAWSNGQRGAWASHRVVVDTSTQFRWSAKYVQGDTCWWDTNCSNLNSPNFEENISGIELHKDYGNAAPGGGMNGDTWIGNYEQSINFPNGNYIFHIDHDDGAKIWINGQQIVSYSSSGINTRCDDPNGIPLNGSYPVRVMLREEGGDAKIHITWDTNTSICQISANFDSYPTTVNVSQAVSMHIVNTSNISSCSWNYGDGITGTSCSPYHDHIYNTAGSYNVTLSVTGPGSISDSMTRNGYITVNNLFPTLTTLSPSSATPGGAAFPLTVNGTNFVSSSIVRWNGSDRTTTYVSATQITAAITAADIATAGSFPVTVFNPTPGGGTSNAVNFPVNPISPLISSISPSSVPAGRSSFALTVNGANFVNGSVVRWNGSARTTTFVSATQLTADIQATDLLSSGSFPIIVLNPNGSASDPVNFTVMLPSLSQISPSSSSAGEPGFTLSVNGSNFVPDSVVRWNGADRPTNFVNSIYLSATISAADIATAGNYPVTVANTSSAVSNAVNFTVTPNCFTLTSSLIPNGSGNISANPPPNCSGGKYNPGTVVQLTANPASGYSFINWTGALTGSVNPSNVTMDNDKSVTANFLVSCNSCGVQNSAWPILSQNLLRNGRSLNHGPQNPVIKWSYPVGGFDGSAPAIGSDGTIYIGLANDLFALTPSGTKIWNYTTGGAVKSPALSANGTIYIGSGDGKLYAINSNGTLKWSFTTGSWISASPAIGADGTLYIGSSDTNLYAINYDGTLKWSYPVGSRLNSSPAIGLDGTIYFGADTSWVYALNPNGTLKWSYQTGSYVAATPSIGSDGTVYIGSGDSYFYAIDSNGNLKWKYLTGGGDSGGSAAIATDGTIYFGSGDGKLYALQSNGILKWSYQTQDVLHNVIIGADGILYAGSYDGHLYALNPNGSLNWSQLLGGRVTPGSAISATGVLYTVAYGTIYAIESTPNHTVTFNSNGGTGSMSPQTANVPTSLTLNAFMRSGYNFAGWNTAVNGSGTAYANGTTYSFAADVTLYAQWMVGPNHTVTFNSNGGTGSMSLQTANIPTALTLNTFTRSGYNFAGWNTAANGSGTAYANGATYSFAADVTLYAQWTALPNPVTLAVVTPSPVTLGQNFNLVVEVRAGTQSVDGAAAYLNFNPTYLRVVSITTGSTLTTILQNSYDNTTGQVNFAAGILSNFPSGTFTLATITFNAQTLIDSTAITFNATAPRKSDVTFGGNLVLGSTNDGSVTITDTVTLNGSVTLQGRPTPPDPRWSVPLTVTLTVPGNSQPAYTFTPATDNSGHFTVTGGITPGIYDIRVKHSHTLRNLKTVTLTTGVNTIDFGMLLEGDANIDNYVAVLDFSILATTYGKCLGTSGYDARADFNGDTCVTLLDFSLLATNYGKGGDQPVTSSVGPEVGRPLAEGVTIRVDPPQSNVYVGNTFTVSIQAQAGSQTVDGAQVSLDFDPTKLRVKQVTGNTTLLPLGLQNTYNNSLGTLDYAAGTISNFPSGTFNLVQIEFEAIGQTAGTSLTFHHILPRNTDISFGGASVLAGDVDGGITITIPYKVYVPLVAK